MTNQLAELEKQLATLKRDFRILLIAFAITILIIWWNERSFAIQANNIIHQLNNYSRNPYMWQMPR